jgi:hypothetical protein
MFFVIVPRPVIEMLVRDCLPPGLINILENIMILLQEAFSYQYRQITDESSELPLG